MLYQLDTQEGLPSVLSWQFNVQWLNYCGQSVVLFILLCYSQMYKSVMLR